MSKRSNFERRLRAVERRLNSEGDGTRPPLKIVLIEGALPREPCHAEAGAHTWTRELPNETLEGFVERCAAEAREFGERLLVVGGLAGPMPETLEEFLATLHFDDVPPVTSPGHRDHHAEPDR